MNVIFGKLKPSVREPLIVYGTGLIITILSGIFFMIIGYPFVNTATETLDILTPPLYMIPVFFPYGILIGEIIWIWNKKKERNTCILFLLELIIISIFSFTRYITSIPFSGHFIILSFFLAHQGISNKLQYPLRFLIGIIVLVITAVYKLLLWNDPITFFLGAIVGIAIWVPAFLYRIKSNKQLDAQGIEHTK